MPQFDLHRLGFIALAGLAVLAGAIPVLAHYSPLQWVTIQPNTYHATVTAIGQTMTQEQTQTAVAVAHLPALAASLQTSGGPPPAPKPGNGGGNTGSSSSEQQIAQGVFSKLNQDRASYGLPPLLWSTALVASAHQHNLAMASANLMEHQVPGEADLGTRISAQGVSWSYIEENIGWTTDESQAGALGIHQAMMNEVPPDDGHRTNILSANVSYIGIDILIDSAHGKLWLTEDFAQFS